MTATERILSLTASELAKLDEIQRACPLLDAQLVSRGDGYLVMGYWPERETVLIRIENDSLSQAVRQYRAAYSKLQDSGLLKANVMGASA